MRNRDLKIAQIVELAALNLFESIRLLHTYVSEDNSPLSNGLWHIKLRDLPGSEIPWELRKYMYNTGNYKTPVKPRGSFIVLVTGCSLNPGSPIYINCQLSRIRWLKYCNTNAMWYHGTTVLLQCGKFRITHYFNNFSTFHEQTA